MPDELKDFKELICNTIGVSCWLGFGFSIAIVLFTWVIAVAAHFFR